MNDAETEMALYDSIRNLWEEIDAQARITTELVADGDLDRAEFAAKEYSKMTARATEMEEMAFHLARKRETDGEGTAHV